MTTKISSAQKFLERISGGALNMGRLINSLRLCDEVSQTDFARRLHISRAHLCDIEKGRKAVSPARAAQFAKILGYPEQQFVKIAVQDLLREAKLNYKVEIKAA